MLYLRLTKPRLFLVLPTFPATEHIKMAPPSLSSIPAEIRVMIFRHLFKPACAIIDALPNGEVDIGQAVFSRIDPHIFRVCKGFCSEGRTALASCLVVTFNGIIPSSDSIPVSFSSFYLPRVQHITLGFWQIHNFDAVMFPNLRYLEVDGSMFYFGPATVRVDSVEEAVAVIGGAMNERLVERMQEEWTRVSSEENINNLQGLLSNTARRFKIIDTIFVSLRCRYKDPNLSFTSCLVGDPHNLSFDK
jgi:hypothetical protein